MEVLFFLNSPEQQQRSYSFYELRMRISKVLGKHAIMKQFGSFENESKQSRVKFQGKTHSKKQSGSTKAMSIFDTNNIV